MVPVCVGGSTVVLRIMHPADEGDPVHGRHGLLGPIALLGAALLLTSCGLRVEPSLRAQGMRGATGQGVQAAAGVQQLAGRTTGGATTGAALPGTTGAVLGGTTGATTGGISTTGTGGTGPSVPAPPGGNGGATDVGVTATSITMGNVSTLSGPVPGLFAGAVYGARAYFAYQNSLGGVYGRQLDLSVADDQLDCGQNRTQHQALAPKVFGFTSSLSLYDNCGAEILKQQKTVSDVSLSFSTQSGGLPNNFSIAPLVPGYRLGSLLYYKKKFPTAITHMATLYGNVGAAPAIWQSVKKAAESVGYHVSYERGYTAGETDFTADVIQMRQQGVQMLYFISADAATIARVANTAAQQQWKPQLFAVGAGDAAYDPGFMAQGGSAVEGMYADQAQALFFGKADAQHIPGVARYQTWMAKIGQSNHTDLYSAWGWGQAALAVQGLQKAGPHLTRTGFLAALQGIHRFDGDGMFSVTDPASKKPATCYVVLRIQNQQYTRVDTPADAFRCDGGYYYAR
jgi:ABC-type branched-subunit amino acid transport system substrate-binding protein